MNTNMPSVPSQAPTILSDLIVPPESSTVSSDSPVSGVRSPYHAPRISQRRSDAVALVPVARAGEPTPTGSRPPHSDPASTSSPSSWDSLNMGARRTSADIHRPQMVVSLGG